MAEAEWDARIRRTGFYETHKAKDNQGFSYPKPVPVCLVTIGDSGHGPFVEPGDCLPFHQPAGVTSTEGGSSESVWGKCDEVVELGTRMNEILEQKTGEAVPTPLHACSFGWPL